MTRNKRYESHYNQLQDQRIADSAARLTPTTLPQQAYGPQPLTWAGPAKPPVWVWVSWQDAPATRIPALATGWNDRVVIIEWEAVGGRRSAVVWRNAVTRRTV